MNYTLKFSVPFPTNSPMPFCCIARNVVDDSLAETLLTHNQAVSLRTLELQNGSVRATDLMRFNFSANELKF